MGNFVCDGSCAGNELGDCSHPEASASRYCRKVMPDDEVAQRPTGDDAILDGDDVSVKPIERDTCECGEPETHAVWLDLRPIGVQSVVVTGCAACAEHYAHQLRTGMR